jgi:hypothetical protein
MRYTLGVSFTVLFFRHLGPAITVLAGIIVFAVGQDVTAAEGAAGIIGAGLAWWLFGWLFRLGVSGDSDRDDEEAARRYFDEHGHWPDEAPKR